MSLNKIITMTEIVKETYKVLNQLQTWLEENGNVQLDVTTEEKEEINFRFLKPEIINLISSTGMDNFIIYECKIPVVYSKQQEILSEPDEAFVFKFKWEREEHLKLRVSYSDESLIDLNFLEECHTQMWALKDKIDALI